MARTSSSARRRNRRRSRRRPAASYASAPAAAPTTAPPAPPRRRRPPARMLVAGAAVVALAGGLLVALWPAGVPDIAPGRRPAAYEVVYRVTDLTSSPARVSWERLAVRRPFQSRYETFAERPAASSTPQSGTLSDYAQMYLVKPDGLYGLSGRQPGPGSYDQDLLPQMGESVARGLARVEGDRTVAGRACRVYRLFEPPAGVIKPLDQTDNHDDMCLDADGLVLAEDWTYQGKHVQSRVAESVALSAPAALFSVGQAKQPAPPGTAIAVVGSRQLSTFMPDPPAPAGFRAGAPVSFLQPDISSGFMGAAAAGAPLFTSRIWAFSRGGDEITVEAVSTGPGRQTPWDPAAGVSRPVRLDHLGDATTVISSDSAEIRVRIGDGRWLRIRGTVPLAQLVAYADGIPVPPSGQ